MRIELLTAEVLKDQQEPSKSNEIELTQQELIAKQETEKWLKQEQKEQEENKEKPLSNIIPIIPWEETKKSLHFEQPVKKIANKNYEAYKPDNRKELETKMRIELLKAEVLKDQQEHSKSKEIELSQQELIAKQETEKWLEQEQKLQEENKEKPLLNILSWEETKKSPHFDR